MEYRTSVSNLGAIVSVRGIALTPTQGLARGMTVEDTGGPLKVPVGKGSLSRMFDVFGNALRREGEVSDVAHRPSRPPPLARNRRGAGLREECEWIGELAERTIESPHDRVRFEMGRMEAWRSIGSRRCMFYGRTGLQPTDAIPETVKAAQHQQRP